LAHYQSTVDFDGTQKGTDYLKFSVSPADSEADFQRVRYIDVRPYPNLPISTIESSTAAPPRRSQLLSGSSTQQYRLVRGAHLVKGSFIIAGGVCGSADRESSVLGRVLGVSRSRSSPEIVQSAIGGPVRYASGRLWVNFVGRFDDMKESRFPSGLMVGYLSRCQ
jgi:hypothetical protein